MMAMAMLAPQPMVAMGQRTDLVIVHHRNFEVPKPQSPPQEIRPYEEIMAATL